MKAIKEFITSYEDIGFTLWFIIPGILSIIIGYTSAQYAENSKDWPEAEGRILSVQLERNSTAGIKTPGGGHSSGHTSYKPVIKYEYYVNGVKYESTNLSFGNNSYSDHTEAKNILNGYKTGQYINVYYKPDNPKVVVLNRGFNGIPTSLIVGIGFIGVSIPLLIVAVINKLRNMISVIRK